MGALDRQVGPAGPAPFPAEPRVGPPLEVDPRAERVRIEKEASGRLETYGWTDREAGLARIPVERAIAILAEHGWPDPQGPQDGGAR